MKIPIALLLAGSLLTAQTATDTPEAHVAVAKTAAGDDYQNLFNFLCAAPANRGGGGGGGRGAGAGAGGGGGAQRGQGGGQRGPQAPPERSTWYAEPVKVFDNFYFVGQSEYSVWAITTSEGIILIDTIFDYSVEEEVIGGLKKLGLNPANIKYAVVSHPHPDHHGGAKFLQDMGVPIIMSAADWDALDRSGGTKPKRDMVATDGQKLTLGDTTITMVVTPGHTPGTISFLIPVKDNGRPHLAAMWGGTGLNADRESITNYVQSAKRFTDIARQAGADMMLSNHTDWDGSKIKLPAVAKRVPGTPHPFVGGSGSVLRYMKVAEECATARLMRLN